MHFGGAAELPLGKIEFSRPEVLLAEAEIIIRIVGELPFDDRIGSKIGR
jgi:hypothetical protein